MELNKKNIILFVGNVYDAYIEEIKEMNKKSGYNFRIALLRDIDTKINLSLENQKAFDYFEMCNSKNKKEIRDKLDKIKSNIVSVHIVYEKYMEFYIDVLKILQIKDYSSPSSLRASVDKLKMRRAFYKYDPKITPKFIQVKSKKDVGLIAKKIGFPCIIKPAHLFKSKLVSVSDNLEDLKNNIENTFELIQKTYSRLGVKSEPIILAEEMMDGKPYTTDIYIDENKKMHFTPFIFQITAKDLGIYDFYIYARINPSGLAQKEIKDGVSVAKKCVLALGVKNTVIHMELMKTDEGWKIIEVGPRIGGYRSEMLKSAYGINHFENCVLTRLSKRPVINDKIIKYTAVIEIFPEKEGYLKSIKGIRKIKKLNSFVKMTINYKVGDFVGLSKNGHKHIFHFYLGNKSKKVFYNDLEVIKKIVNVKIEEK
ncbi:MAG: ATP-grasp domain-containing protein [Patescibacteria group bacterium]|nr:ATP-grasp domain-containing protein [Patescibacteria group bacterium]